jgi:alpha-D-ribose 1-methylphosphonate 5-triphosphate synthase subunit PhnH
MASLRLALDPVHDTQAVFRVLLEALSHPGETLQIPAPALDAPANPWVASVLLTLLDHETSFASVSCEALDGFVRSRTNARLTAVDEADFVLARAESLTPKLINDLKRGSLAYPDESATLVVSALHNLPTERLELSGPGILSRREVHLPLQPSTLDALAGANANYPCGVDVYLIDAGGQVIGLPRTTRVARS